MPGTTDLVVTSTERRTPNLVRVRFRSDDLGAFAESVYTDRYVKLVIPTADGDVVRTYTALEPDVEAGTLAIDFVVHGDDGFAGPWAARAEPGDLLTVRGPGGAYAPDPAADWHLFAGDESAIPAIGAALAALPAGATAYVVLEVAGPDHHVDLPSAADVEVAVGCTAVSTRRSSRRSGHCRGGRGGCMRSCTARPRPSCTASGPTCSRTGPPACGRLDLGLLAAGPHRGGLPRLEGRARGPGVRGERQLNPRCRGIRGPSGP